MEVAVPVIIALLSAVVGAFVNTQSNRETNETNRQIAAQNNQTQIELQQMMNEYNSPVNQLARLREAGYSQSIGLTGNGLVDAGNQKTLPQLSAATMQPYQMDTSGFQAAANILSQKRLMDSQAQNLDADTAKKLSEVPDAEQGRRESQAREDKSRKEIEFIQQQIVASKSEVEQSTLRTLADVRKIDADIAHIETQRQLTQKEVDTYDERIKTELENLKTQTKNLAAQARKTTADAIEQEHDTAAKDAWLYGSDGSKYSSRYADVKTSIHQLEVYQHQMENLIDEASRIKDNKGLADFMYKVNMVTSALQGTISKLQQAGMAVATKKP